MDMNNITLMVVQLYWLFLLDGLFQKGRQALICSLLEVILMAKIKIISHPFQVIPVLPGGNTLLSNIFGDLTNNWCWNLEHE